MEKIKDNNTYLATPKLNPKDLVEVIIGDDKEPDIVLPQAKIQRWDNESNVSIRLKDFNNYGVTTDKDKVIFGDETREVHFYQVPDGEGATEIEVILKEKPKTNVIEFTLVDKDVEYFYQPELTQEEIKQGASRPDNVVGSYAVYAKTPKTNWTGGKEYKCGKIGHIFRPQIIDAEGTKVWGELLIKDGILSVTIPQDFLDKGIYPIRHAAGLTIGYTSIGSNAISCSTSVIYASKMNWQASNNGIMSKIQICAYDAGGDSHIKLAVYNDSSGVPGTLVANSSSGELTVTRTTKPTQDSQWTSSTSVSGSLVSGNYYWTSFYGENSTVLVASDNGSIGDYKYKNTGVAYADYPYATFPTSLINSNQKLSIYATYTAAASGPANLKSRSGNLKANIKSMSGNLIANIKSLSGNS